jgi:two-component SAPR family response regulator
MAYLRGPLKKATGATSAQFVLDASGRYCLDPSLVGVDLAVFDQLRVLAAGSQDPGERAAAAEAALSLYDGELLTGNDEPWTMAPRADVRREALACAALLAQLAADAGEPETALAWWEHARSIDDNDEVYHQIFSALATLGRRAELIAARDALIAKLESIGESLSPQTEQLLGELLRERPRPAAVGAAQPVAA